jgi:hypothetical protein
MPCSKLNQGAFFPHKAFVFEFKIHQGRPGSQQGPRGMQIRWSADLSCLQHQARYSASLKEVRKEEIARYHDFKLPTATISQPGSAELALIQHINGGAHLKVYVSTSFFGLVPTPAPLPLAPGLDWQ